MIRFISTAADILFKIWIVLLVIFALAFGVASAIGWRPYTILTASMTDTYNVGDLVYIDTNYPVDDLKKGDAIAFSLADGTTCTHRIHDIDDQGRFITKGDANNSVDASPVTKDEVIGKALLDFGIPYLGTMSKFFRENMIIVIIGAFLIALMLHILSTLNDDEDEKDDEDEDSKEKKKAKKDEDGKKSGRKAQKNKGLKKRKNKRESEESQDEDDDIDDLDNDIEAMLAADLDDEDDLEEVGGAASVAPVTVSLTSSSLSSLIDDEDEDDDVPVRTTRPQYRSDADGQQSSVRRTDSFGASSHGDAGRPQRRNSMDASGSGRRMAPSRSSSMASGKQQGAARPSDRSRTARASAGDTRPMSSDRNASRRTPTDDRARQGKSAGAGAARHERTPYDGSVQGQHPSQKRTRTTASRRPADSQRAKPRQMTSGVAQVGTGARRPQNDQHSSRTRPAAKRSGTVSSADDAIARAMAAIDGSISSEGASNARDIGTRPTSRRPSEQ